MIDREAIKHLRYFPNVEKEENWSQNGTLWNSTFDRKRSGGDISYFDSEGTVCEERAEPAVPRTRNTAVEKNM